MPMPWQNRRQLMEVLITGLYSLTESTMLSTGYSLLYAKNLQHQQLYPLLHSLSFDAAKLLVQAFTSTCLDYCNSLLYAVYGISDNLCWHLQAFQDVTTRLITNRCEHITPILQQLRWLQVPVRQCVQFKIAMLVYNALHDLLPAYLAEDCKHWMTTTAFVRHQHVPSAEN